MYAWTHSVTTSATPDQVWPLYADVHRWPEWDAGLQAVTLDGSFTLGSTGTLTIKGQPPLPWSLVEVVAGESFTDVTEIPGVATLTFGHRIEAVAAGSRITHEVLVEGPAAEQLGPMVTADTPEAMLALARLAEAS